MPFIFKAEGGYSPTIRLDPGGPTNFGITLATLRAYEGNPNLTAHDVKKLTPAVAKEIYRTAYWNRMQCGSLPAGLDLEVFDFGVNSGPAEAVKALQKIVGVTSDGSNRADNACGRRTVQMSRDLIGRFAHASCVLPGPEYARVRAGLGDTRRANPDRGRQDVRDLAEVGNTA